MSTPYRFLLASMLLWSCNPASGPKVGAAEVRPPKSQIAAAAALDVAVKNVTLAEAGLDPSAIDRSVHPCDDLYQHACGGWIKTFQIPDSAWGYEKVFSQGIETTDLRLRDILENLPTHNPTKEEERLGDFYRACMDERTIELRGLEPIEGYLGKLNGAASREQLAAAVGEVHTIFDAFFRFGTMPNPRDSSVLIGWLGWGGIGRLSKDSYLNTDARSVARRNSYEEYALRVLRLANKSAVEAHAIFADAMRFQVALATAMEPIPSDVDEELNPVVDLGGLERLAPGFPWKTFFQSLGLASTNAFLVYGGGFITRMAKLFASHGLIELKHYAYWRMLADTNFVLGKSFAEERARLSRATGRSEEQEPRWRTCVNATRWALSDSLTHRYVDRYFPATTRTSFQGMFDAFVSAFGERLDELDWMDDATRKNARLKLSRMTIRIGYPDRFTDYDFAIHSGTYGENVLLGILAQARQRFAGAGKTFDRIQWYRSPLDTNAFVDNWQNAAVFPAAILQPPTFDPTASLPVRFGAIGFHLGHEMTHGFDNLGARHDGGGNRANWWSLEAWRRFEQKASCLKEQYEDYEPIIGTHVDGRRTLSENIADLGGLKLAFRAYRNARKGSKEVSVAEGYSEDQQFFVSYAQNHCVKFGSEADLRRYLENNIHAPHWLRVNGVVRNMPEFAEAFQCRAPTHTCEIW